MSALPESSASSAVKPSPTPIGTSGKDMSVPVRQQLRDRLRVPKAFFNSKLVYAARSSERRSSIVGTGVTNSIGEMWMNDEALVSPSIEDVNLG